MLRNFRHFAIVVAAFLLILTSVAATPAAGAAPTLADYRELTEHRLGGPIPVPGPGVEWTIDSARWHLEKGSVRLQAGATPTGLHFEGRGTLEWAIPDRFELQQLRRFMGVPELSALRLEFDEMILRASGGPPFDTFGSSASGTGSEPAFDERLEHALVIRRLDVDSSVLAALGDPQALYWRADIHTIDHGWLTFTFDSQRVEELTLETFDKKYGFIESWLSLDRQEHRLPSGRPGDQIDPVIDILHVDVKADLTEPAPKFHNYVAAEFEVELELEILRDGLSAIPLRLHSRAEVTAVTRGDGTTLEFVRDHVGARSNSIDKEVYVRSLLLLPGETLPGGARERVRVEYRMAMPKYAPGRSWYPGGRDGGGLRDRHTARFELTTDDRHDLQAMGELVDERSEGKTKTTVWQLDRPAKMVTFTMQRSNYTTRLEFDGLPEIVTVGDLSGGARVLNEERIDAVAGDTANAVNYFQALLDSRLPEPQFYAAMIASGHGQAFPGFLHLSEWTTAIDSTAVVERFRAHEVGHQWWGHIVGWSGYRDQWLSEGFAEYLALMFVEATVDGGTKQLQEAISAYSNEVRGSLESSFSQFARPGYSALSARGADRMGPIGHGWRAGVGEAPSAYQTLAYYKGALVLHMLRTLTRHMTKSDDAFVAILRDFVRSNQGRYATTADLEAAVTRQVPADWSWFFDQWVYGAEVPTYRWSHEMTTRDGKPLLRLTVEQQNVSPGFKMGVPVALQFGKGKVGELLVFVDQPTQTFEFPLPSKPKKIIFNAGDAVIANVKKGR